MAWDYPTYMTDYHEDWVIAMNTALGASTFPALTVYDPDTDLCHAGFCCFQLKGADTQRCSRRVPWAQGNIRGSKHNLGEQR